ncbi:MAG: hypothetical protein WC916_02960 [Candidatus Woesearchaeota archaeon]
MDNLAYLDTNVFSLLSEDLSIQNNFVLWTKKNKSKVVISVTTLSELFQKESKFHLFNKLMNNSELHFLFLGSYTLVSQLEINNYPNNINIETLSLNEIISKLLEGKHFDFFDLKKSKFAESVEKQKDAANREFRLIVSKWKKIFPPDNINFYSKQQQTKLREMIIRNIKTSLSRNYNINNLDLSKLKTRMIINETLMKKYLFNYVRNFDPNDFADLMHIAYSPYMSFFITEKNNLDILEQIKKKTSLLSHTELIKISDLNNKLQ